MFRDCITEIIKITGENVLNDSHRFIAYVNDLADDYPEERSFVTSFFDAKYLSFFAEAGNNPEKVGKASIKASQYIVSQNHADKEWAEKVSDELKFGILKYYNAAQVNKKRGAYLVSIAIVCIVTIVVLLIVASSKDNLNVKSRSGNDSEIDSEDTERGTINKSAGINRDKLKNYLEGRWVCRDCSDKDGMVISISWNGETGKATIKESPDNSYSPGDIKWANIKIKTRKRIFFNDKSVNDIDKAEGAVSFKKNQIKCRLGGNDDTQVWIKESEIDKRKEVIKDDEFDDSNDYLNSYTYYDCGEYERGIYGISVPSGHFIRTRSSAIDHYSYGHIIYQSYKNEQFYTLSKRNTGPYDRHFRDVLKHLEYSVVYFDKENNWFIKMYFDKYDRAIGVAISNTTYYSVK